MRNKLVRLDKRLSVILNYLFPIFICFPYPRREPPKPMLLPSFVHIPGRMKGAKANTKSPHLQKSKWNMLDSQASQTNPDHKSVFHRGQKHTLTTSTYSARILCTGDP